jgi:hypothetical protein
MLPTVERERSVAPEHIFLEECAVCAVCAIVMRGVRDCPLAGGSLLDTGADITIAV